MSTKLISENELTQRLLASGRLTEDQIIELLDQYAEATTHQLPDMQVIEALARQGSQTRPLRVSFELDREKYDALLAYFSDTNISATTLVQRTVDEFLAFIA